MLNLFSHFSWSYFSLLKLLYLLIYILFLYHELLCPALFIIIITIIIIDKHTSNKVVKK